MFRWPLTTANGIDFELRLLEMCDADELFALATANRGHLCPWLPWVAWTHSTADVRTFLRGALKQFGEGDGFHAGLWVDGRLSGCIGLHPVDWRNRQVALGYWLDRACEGNGFVTSAVRAVTLYCFRELELERVEIRAASGNVRSRAIPERLGFTLEGTLRHAQYVDGQWLDNMIYAMLRAEAGRLGA